ncbi:gp16 family protein [Donghicola sp.]|jgi:phage gp16-like protein|uniref:gp16 family protein n=1 Tax=Donghicola sp. TaxID=1929294 RepID=UPI0025F456EC|nr:regulatory protein GemA [Donghicola sp.]MCT4576862.1 regulatory protein GemA [Donghicola sp.]
MSGSLQRKIHVGCKQLGLDNEARRTLQLVETGKESLKDMDEGDMLKVLARLKRDGFTDAKPKAKRHPKAKRADLRLIHVLWSKLGEAGALKDPSRTGLNKFIRTRFEANWGSVPADVDMLADSIQIDDVVQALKAWASRVEADFDFMEHRK